MADNKWKYVAGGAKSGEVDCSGAFTYWYKQAGSYMFHGSNTIWRNYAPTKGKIGEIKLVPGMAVYKHRNDNKEPDKYKNDGLGNFYHIGLYIGDDMVVEAKGVASGVVYSKLSTWTHCSTLKYTEYDVDEGVVDSDTNYPVVGIVKINSGHLNVREKPTTGSSVVRKLLKGDRVTLEGKTDGWYAIDGGYVSEKYITLAVKKVSFMVDEDKLDDVLAYLNSAGIEPVVDGE